MQARLEMALDWARTHVREIGAWGLLSVLLWSLARELSKTIFFDWLKGALFDLVGGWIGVSDSNLLAYFIVHILVPLTLSGFVIWWAIRRGMMLAGGPLSFLGSHGGDGTSTITLTPPQQRLLSLIAKHQRQFGANKLVILRQSGVIAFAGDKPLGETGPNLAHEVFGLQDDASVKSLETLMESLPQSVVRFFAEARFDNPFVVGVTEAGQRYLAQVEASEAAIGAQRSHAHAILKQTNLLERQRNEERHEGEWRKAIRDHLGEAILKARPLLDQLQDHDAKPPIGDITGWNYETAQFIRATLGAEYEARFTEPATYSDEQLGPLGRDPVNVLKIGLQDKVRRLYTMMDDLK